MCICELVLPKENLLVTPLTYVTAARGALCKRIIRSIGYRCVRGSVRRLLLGSDRQINDKK